MKLLLHTFLAPDSPLSRICDPSVQRTFSYRASIRGGKREQGPQIRLRSSCQFLFKIKARAKLKLEKTILPIIVFAPTCAGVLVDGATRPTRLRDPTFDPGRFGKSFNNR